jgi:hypothetical protein
MSSSTEFMAGFTGSRVVSGTSAVTGNWRGFIVNADCVVSAILDEANASLLTSLGLSGVTLRQGAFIVVPEEKIIRSITLTSGSVVMYNI